MAEPHGTGRAGGPGGLGRAAADSGRGPGAAGGRGHKGGEGRSAGGGGRRGARARPGGAAPPGPRDPAQVGRAGLGRGRPSPPRGSAEGLPGDGSDRHNNNNNKKKGGSSVLRAHLSSSPPALGAGSWHREIEASWRVCSGSGARGNDCRRAGNDYSRLCPVSAAPHPLA